LKSSIKKNYFYNVSYQIFALIVPLITTPYVSRVLGAGGIGEYSYTFAIIKYFWLLSALGAATFGAKSIGIVQENKEKRSYAFWNLFSLKVILSLFFIILYILYVIFFAENRVIAFIQGINLIAVMFDITWFFQGMEEFKKISIKNFIIKVINIIFIFMFVKTKDDLNIYVFGLAFFLLIGNLSMWGSLSKYISKVPIKKLRPFKDFKGVVKLFIPSIAVEIFSIFDKSMIGWFTESSEENGYYEQSLKIIYMAVVVITTMGTIMVPKISREYSKGKVENVNKYLNKSIRFSLMLAIPMTFGLISISEKFVLYFFGAEYFKATYLINILSILFIFMGVNSVTGSQYLISTGQENKHIKFLLIGGGINIVLNCILIPKFMSIGAAIASVIGEGTIMFLELRYLKEQKQYNLKENLKYTIKYLIMSIAMFVSIKFVGKNINSILDVVVVSAIGGIIYLVLLVITKDELVIEEFNSIRNRLGRGVN